MRKAVILCVSCRNLTQMFGYAAIICRNATVANEKAPGVKPGAFYVFLTL